MSILQNAIDSIELGVEDYKTDEPKRLLSAVRNFYAGILLLFKHKLAQLSIDDDEALLKQEVLPVEEEGKIVWKGKGKKTVDFQQIQKRFESLGIEVDWKRLAKAQEYRNNIEHYYDRNDTKHETVRQYISGCFIIICDFIRNNLGAEPKGLFSSPIWEVLVEEEQVYEAEKKICYDGLNRLKWFCNTVCGSFEFFMCENCFSDLLEPIDTTPKNASECSFQCRACDAKYSYEDILPKALDSEGEYRRIKDGGDPIQTDCPECGGKYYFTTEEICFKCGARGPYHCSRRN